MNLNNLEKHIKDKVYHEEDASFDLDAIMERIPHKQPNKNRPWLLLFVAAVAAVALFYTWQMDDRSQLALKQAKLEPNGSSQVESAPQAANIVLTEPSAVERSSASKTMTPSLSHENAPVVAVQTVENSNGLKKKQDVQRSLNQEVGSTPTSLDVQNEQYDIAGEIEKSRHKNQDLKNIRNLSTENVDRPTYFDKFANYTPNNAHTEYYSTEYLDFSEQDISLDTDGSLKVHGSLPDKVVCPTFGSSNPWMLELGLATGISKPIKSIRAKNTDLSPANTTRVENEKSLEGLDLETFVSAKRTSWPVYFRFGINYSRWAERMSIDDKYTEQDTVIGIISTTVSENGDTITHIYGDVIVERMIEIKQLKHYYFHRFDLPISLVYETNFGDNSLQFELGLQYNLANLAKGLFYVGDYNFESVEGVNQFKKLTGLSYFGKLHYRRYLNQNFFLGTNLYFQYLPGDFSSGNAEFSQRYLNTGAQVYAGYTF